MIKVEIETKDKKKDHYYTEYAGHCSKSKDGLLYKHNIDESEYYLDYELVNFGEESVFAPSGISKHHFHIYHCPFFCDMVEISRKEYSEAKKRFLANSGQKTTRT